MLLRQNLQNTNRQSFTTVIRKTDEITTVFGRNNSISAF